MVTLSAEPLANPHWQVAPAILKDAGLLFPRIFQCRRYVFRVEAGRLIWVKRPALFPPSPLRINHGESL